ncbi:di-heme oxidoredictase family protein [Thalassotalea litorea]|uniref:di-heme oxidoredictase family protein n=1 Tax=Thalassotalea litorea TaxID=2020715 RepID=UPI00373707C7
MAIFRAIFYAFALPGITFLSTFTQAQENSLEYLSSLNKGIIEHCDESLDSGVFIDIFECGDELFGFSFNALDGGGMNVGDGGRLTRVPRADLFNWSNTIPRRKTGPNAAACSDCHAGANIIGGGGNGGGAVVFNAIRDPFHTGQPGQFIQRNTTHVFGMAGLQLLAEEMTEELQGQVAKTLAMVCETGSQQQAALSTKGMDFGSVRVDPPCNSPSIDVQSQGVKDDLIVRPFQWKGSELSVRNFSRDAFQNELGMDPVELTGDDIDGDFDGVVNEISIADITAMVIYLAAQPRPTSLIELDELRQTLEGRQYGDIGGSSLAQQLMLPTLSVSQRREIKRGKRLFDSVDCSSCHKPSMVIEEKFVYSEPSDNPMYKDAIFPGGQLGISDAQAIRFDIRGDQPQNQIVLNDTLVKHLGAFETDASGQVIVRLYGDLKLHDMGPELAENIDETGTGASVWMTKELWGVGSTPPYLHDGRATTLEEAILAHGGEADSSKLSYTRLNESNRKAILAFLNNLVLYLPAEGD